MCRVSWRVSPFFIVMVPPLSLAPTVTTAAAAPIYSTITWRVKRCSSSEGGSQERT
jgi:hypothetical protein